jgi:deoxyribodipyrimidine photo-lyase
MTETTIVWFRRDLRLSDNPALNAAALRGAIVPVFIWSPDEEAPWQPGAASRWWLHHSLAALRDELTKLGVPLVIRSGPSLETLRALVRETKATGVYWNRLYEPAVITRDSEVKKALRDADGLDVRSYNGALLNEPWEVLTQTEKPYQVFSPYHRACLAKGPPPSPLPIANLKSVIPNLKSQPLESLALLPKIKWDTGFYTSWQPGEAGAQKMLTKFAAHCSDYAGRRDFPHDLEGTSRLSPFLHFGEISPRQIWHAAQSAKGMNAMPYQRQLVWREFAHQLLYHFPHTALRCVPSSATSRGRKTTSNCAHGSRGAPAIQSWTRGCASCGRPATCTIAFG